MYGIYANIGGILMVNVTIYSIHGSYGLYYAYYANGNSNLMLSYVAGSLFDASCPYGTTIIAVFRVRNRPMWCPIVLPLHSSSN